MQRALGEEGGLASGSAVSGNLSFGLLALTGKACFGRTSSPTCPRALAFRAGGGPALYAGGPRVVTTLSCGYQAERLRSEGALRIPGGPSGYAYALLVSRTGRWALESAGRKGSPCPPVTQPGAAVRRRHFFLAVPITIVAKTQAVRMEGRPRFSIDCPEELREVSLPPQPLVENSIRHALEPRPEGGTLSVVGATLEGEEFLVEVQDDGPGLHPHRPAGIGLTNVRERVVVFSGGRGALVFAPEEKGGLCARITFLWSAEAGPAPGAAAGGRS